jgi:predicted HicB family RNase H-like nuclease
VREVADKQRLEEEAEMREKNVITRKENIPEFESEAEEAEFWATHSMGGELLEATPEEVAEAEAELPSPREYSGKVNIRMPRSLHRDLVRRAEREGVSLNQLMVVLLARELGSEDRRSAG